MNRTRERRLLRGALEVSGMSYEQVEPSIRALARARYSPRAAACSIRRIVLALARKGVSLDGDLSDILHEHGELNAGIRATKAAHDIRQNISWVRNHCRRYTESEGGEDE